MATMSKNAVVLILVWTAISSSDRGFAQSAGEILSETGIRGGLVVRLGCGDGKLTAALRANDSYLVQVLDTDPKNVEQARKNIRELGVYGKVTATRYDGAHLPYIDNVANLLVAEDLGKVSMSEATRVLVPLGVAYLREDGEWTKKVKPWPQDMDEWTHYLHAPDRNPVALDRAAGPPRRLQWQNGRSVPAFRCFYHRDRARGGHLRLHSARPRFVRLRALQENPWRCQRVEGR